MEKILNCINCNLCKNQKPLIDKNENGDIFFVGLSAKKVQDKVFETPLDENTNSGKLIQMVVEKYKEFSFYRTNLVKCLPLSENNKLRYPTKKEVEQCIPNLNYEIEVMKPKIIILLGNEVFKNILKEKYTLPNINTELTYNCFLQDEKYFIPIHHPSYICVYKRKYINNYINAISNIIESFKYLI